MTLVVLVPIRRIGLAVLRVAVLRADILNLVGVVGLGYHVPDQGAPAGDLGDAVTQGH